MTTPSNIFIYFSDAPIFYRSCTNNECCTNSVWRTNVIIIKRTYNEFCTSGEALLPRCASTFRTTLNILFFIFRRTNNEGCCTNNGCSTSTVAHQWRAPIMGAAPLMDAAPRQWRAKESPFTLHRNAAPKVKNAPIVLYDAPIVCAAPPQWHH